MKFSEWLLEYGNNYDWRGYYDAERTDPAKRSSDFFKDVAGQVATNALGGIGGVVNKRSGLSGDTNNAFSHLAQDDKSGEIVQAFYPDLKRGDPKDAIATYMKQIEEAVRKSTPGGANLPPDIMKQKVNEVFKKKLRNEIKNLIIDRTKQDFVHSNSNHANFDTDNPQIVQTYFDGHTVAVVLRFNYKTGPRYDHLRQPRMRKIAKGTHQ